MGIFDDLKKWAHPYDDEDEEYEEDFPDLANRGETGAFAERGSARSSAAKEDDRRNKVVNIHATTQLKVVLVKPERFENAAEIGVRVPRLDQIGRGGFGRFVRRLFVSGGRLDGGLTVSSLVPAVDFGVGTANEGKRGQQEREDQRKKPFVHTVLLVVMRFADSTKSLYGITPFLSRADKENKQKNHRGRSMIPMVSVCLIAPSLLSSHEEGRGRGPGISPAFRFTPSC